MALIRDVNYGNLVTDSNFVKQFKIDNIELKDGTIRINVDFDDSFYYQILSDLIGVDIKDEYQLIGTLRKLANMKSQYEKIGNAYDEVKQKGYGVVSPCMEEISLEDPEIIRHGGKYGVKIKAQAPSIHMIKADIETEIAPIVGSEEQAKDLINYIHENCKDNPDGIWDTNIFGKSIKQLVEDGIYTKVNKMTEESQQKLQDTMQKIVNDSNGGIICIII